jgi:N-acetylmuramoyl-L-alanine amidase
MKMPTVTRSWLAGSFFIRENCGGGPVPGKKNNYTRLLFVTLFIIFILSSPVSAAVVGFVTQDSDGNLFKYNYEELLDSYALKILGLSNGLYEDFVTRKNYALLNSSGVHLDYNALMERYVAAVLLEESFDLKKYLQSSEAKKASMPESIVLVTIDDGKIKHETRKTSSSTIQSDQMDQPVKRQTVIIGPSRVTLEKAQAWALEKQADQSFIDIASTYWTYGEKTEIRPEVLYVQAAVETDFGKFSGRLPRDHNNWGGIKLIDAPGDGADSYEQFPTSDDGVRAHFNHIAAFIGLQALGEPHQGYNQVKEHFWAGSVLHVEDLSGKWTTDAAYHEKILLLLNQLVKSAGVEEVTEEMVPEEEPAPPPDSDYDDQNDSDKEHATVNVNLLRLRSGPGTDFEILDLLPMGTVLEITGREKEWLQVITPKAKQGWVYGDYVKKVDMSVSPFNGKTVVVDPGHGGSDPGAIGVTGFREKVLNLAVAWLLAEKLEEAGARVVMTRKGDYAVSNAIRVKVANDSKGDAYVSIHANSFSNPESNGTETYFSPQKNNSADRFLAQQLQRELVTALGFRNRGVKEHNFYILRNTKMPAALVELAFLSNSREEALLKKEETHIKAASALFRGLEAFFIQYP